MLEADDATAPAGSGEDQPAPVSDVETEAPSPETSDTEASGEGTEGETEAEAEEIEFDFGGDKLRVPKGAIPDEIVERLDKFTKGTWSDYTKKSQAVAETMKAAEAQTAFLNRVAALKTDQLSTYASGLQLEAEIDALTKVDLARLWQSDPDQARRVSDTIAQKRVEFERVQAKVAEIGAQFSAEEKARTEALISEGRQKVAKLAPGFDEAKVVQYAVRTFGIPEDQAKQWPLNPAGAAMAHKAMLWDEMQAKAAKAVKPAAPPPAPIKPIQARSAPVQKHPDQMSDEEFVRWRNAHEARKRAQGR
jgi:hypothetical protein